jgi:hypothetical protein
MLRSPAEAAHYANIIMALGMSGRRAAFAPLLAFSRAAPHGEVDRAAYRARTRLPLAMGHLARRHRRAVAWLVAEAEAPEIVPSWSFRHQRGLALAAVLREQTLTGLAISGARAAGPPLDRAASASGERRRRHGRNVRALHDRVAALGAKAVFRESQRRHRAASSDE